MSDEQKIEEELESEDDVEAHKKGLGSHRNDEGDDGEDDVVAHKKGLGSH